MSAAAVWQINGAVRPDLHDFTSDMSLLRIFIASASLFPVRRVSPRMMSSGMKVPVYGVSAVPDRDFTSEMSELLMAPLFVTS